MADIGAIDRMIQILQNADRVGSLEDVPEGARFIMISDALALQMIGELREYIDDLWQDGIDAMGEDA